MSGASRRTARSRGRPSPGEADAGESARGPRHPVEGIRKGWSRDHGPIRLRDVSLKTLLGLGFLASLFVFFLVNNYQWGSLREDAAVRSLRRAVTPLPAPRMMDLPQFQGEHQESLYWGTYRPHVYLGIRARSKVHDAEDSTAHLFFYVADEEGNSLGVQRQKFESRDSTLLAFGERNDVGGWELHLDSQEKLDAHFSGFRTLHMHNLSELVQGTLAFHARRTGQLRLPDAIEDSSNIIVVQISATVPAKIDIAFVSGTNVEGSSIDERINSLTGAMLSTRLEEKQGEVEDNKVPEEFVLQFPTNGNPPTLFLVLRGKDVGTFYWHGRDNTTTKELNPKTLTSGLDDYPRASHPNDEEQHLDLRCWMLLAADCMHSIAELLKMENASATDYHHMSKQLSDFEKLNQMHLDHASGAYFDFGYHTEKVHVLEYEKQN
ncbi:hypothetical protein C4D60_Mb06t12890 [Musa balbisiana]|uniref:Glycosyl hydrolase family 63 C-terminal domain-containing protein n=1 Tax=Musa balbisiana TaxID=52838 RepID=A0A4S8IMK6_MUSBA|nr:hypothetical protein C4D60_Mb06t12890 [Musa balbisiana]